MASRRDSSDDEADSDLSRLFPSFRYGMRLVCSDLYGPPDLPQKIDPSSFTRKTETYEREKSEDQAFVALKYNIPEKKLLKKSAVSELRPAAQAQKTDKEVEPSADGSSNAIGNIDTHLLTLQIWETGVVLDPDAVCNTCFASSSSMDSDGPAESLVHCNGCKLRFHKNCEQHRPVLSPTLPPPPPPPEVAPAPPPAELSPNHEDDDGSPMFTDLPPSQNAQPQPPAPVEPEAAPTFRSIFMLDNEDLRKGTWLANVVLDADESVPTAPLVLDINDTEMLFDATVDIPVYKREEPKFPQLTGRNRIPNWQLNKMDQAEKEAARIKAAGLRQSVKELDDPFNLSVDQYYQPRGGTSNSHHSFKWWLDKPIVHHPPTIVTLSPPHFTTHLTAVQLRNFHRPKLEPDMDKEPKPLAPVPISSAKPSKKAPTSFSSRDGELVLVEYSEEHPPLIERVGMCSLLKLYYRRQSHADTHFPRHKFGTPMSLAPKDGSPFFLGDIAPGKSMFSLENNLFSAPIFEQPDRNSTDFLVIRQSGKYYVRPFPAIFTVGQLMPKVVVPAPESKRANNFMRDFLNVYIYRAFKQARAANPHEEPSIRVEEILRDFQSSSEANIRKRLKECAEFRRGGNETGAWFLRKDVNVPSDADLAAMVTPEMVCAYESMLAARQRLEDMGYRRQAIEEACEAYEKDPEKDMADDESKLAPWRLTADFIDCVNGKCLLALTGPGEPTGCGEGFSLLRMTTKPSQAQEGNRLLPKVQTVKRPAQGSLAKTDKDLRKLKLEEARDILVNAGLFTREQLLKINRWETVSRVRQMANESDDKEHRFVRHNKSSAAEHKEKFRIECQRLFDLQAQTLGSSEVLSSDESSDSEDDGRDSPIASEAFPKPKAVKAEADGDDDDDKSVATATTARKNLPKCLIIKRYYPSKGSLSQREEKIREPRLIAAYLKQAKDDRKNKNRKEYDPAENLMQRDNRPKLEEPSAGTPVKLVTCSRCKQAGHMRTNKACPMASDDEDNGDASVTLDGTKLSIKLAPPQKKKLKKRKNDPEGFLGGADDIFQTEAKIPKKDRTKTRNPEISLNHFLEAIIQHAKKLPVSEPFRAAPETIYKVLSACVQRVLIATQDMNVEDYYKVVKSPMDLTRMLNKASAAVYRSRQEFMEDVRQICFNCMLYNNSNSPLYQMACDMRRQMWRLLAEDTRLIELEMQLNTYDPALQISAAPGAEEAKDIQRLTMSGQSQPQQAQGDLDMSALDMDQPTLDGDSEELAGWL